MKCEHYHLECDEAGSSFWCDCEGNLPDSPSWKSVRDEVPGLIELCDDIKTAYLKQEFFHMGQLIEILQKRLSNLLPSPPEVKE